MATEQPLSDSRKPAGGAKVFDVRRPGQTVASATSRPGIVGHGGQVRDPVIAPDRSGDTVAKPAMLAGARRITIQPTSTDAKLVTDQSTTTETSNVPLATPENADTAIKVSTPEPTPALDVSVSGPQSPTESPVQLSPTPQKESQPLVVTTKTTDTEHGLPDMSHLNTDVDSDVSIVSGNVPPISSGLPQVHQSSKLDFTDGLDMSLDNETQAHPPPSTRTSTKSARSWLPWVVTMVIILLLAAIVVDLLLDGGFIILKHVPHTHFF